MDAGFLGTHTPAAWQDDWYLVNARASKDGVVLTTEPSPTYRSPEPVEPRTPTGFEVADVASSDCGHLYVLFRRRDSAVNRDDDGRRTAGEVHRYDPVRETSTVVVCVPDDRLDPTSLCVTRASIFVASRPRSDAETSGQVRAFARYGGETRWVATTARVRSRDADGATGRTRFERPVALACAGDVVYAVDEGAVDGASGFLTRISAGGAAEVVDDGLVAPRDVAVGDETVLVLDTDDGSVVLAYAVDDVATGPVEPDRVVVPGTDPTFTLSCFDAVSDRDVIAGVGPGAGDETTLFRYRLDDEAMTRVTSYKRSALRLVVERGGENGEGEAGYATGGHLYVVDGADRSIQRLAEVRRNAVNPFSGGVDAQVVRRFDSAAWDTQWHRAVLEAARLGATQEVGGNQVRLRYYATDGDEAVYDLQTIPGIGEARVGKLGEVGIDDVWGLLERSPEAIAGHLETASTEMVATWQSEAWTTVEDRWDGVGRTLDRPDPRDALLSSATGRYLWVRLELVGSEYASPQLSTFRAYFPRQSYLRYLPEVYRADEESADFLERFLSLFESTFTDLGEDIGSITRYLDPGGVPEPYLEWLGRWIGVDLDEAWPEPARRSLLERAPELFTMRGTRAGLLATLEVYLDHVETPGLSWDHARERERARLDDLLARGDLTEDEWAAARDRHAALAADRETPDERPLLLEYSDLDCVDTDAARDAYTRLVSCPQCFLVLLPPSLDEEAARTARRIVETEQPAHTVGRAVSLRREVQLGANSYLGVNSALPRPRLVVDRSGLGTDSVLSTRETHGQLDVKPRVGRDTKLS